MLRTMLMTVVLLLAGVTPARADDATDCGNHERLMLKPDLALALRECRRLAEQGDVNVQYTLGFIYQNGRGGIPQDSAEGMKWLRKAADQGDSRAQVDLGAGHQVAGDNTEAVKWYRMAAEQRNAWGQRQLGLMYAIGLGVPQDDVQAYMWFNLADAQGVIISDMARRDVAKRMTPEQIEKAERLAREWMQKHAQ